MQHEAYYSMTIAFASQNAVLQFDKRRIVKIKPLHVFHLNIL